MRFRPEEVQFLYNNEKFSHRRLEIGCCPKCDKLLARLVETRIVDGKVFDTTYKNVKAEDIIRQLKDEIQYSSLDVPKHDGLFGFRYGENTERINKKTGEHTITQKACDFYGSKEVVKTFKSHNM